MSYNGSGTFLINTAGQPVVSGTVISSTAFNALTADLATGLSTAITKDGQTTVTANIPMSTYKFTGLGVGSAATDSANLSQVQSTVTKLLNSVSGADTITATASPTLAAYAAGQMFYFVAAGDNTTSVTLNIDSLGAKAVTRDGATALAAADIKSGEVVVVVYDGTRFQVVSQLNSAGDARFANVSIASSLYVGGVSTFVGNAGFSANVSIASALSVGGVAAITGATTIGGNLTLSGGTANGVLYLNGSKVATSGSALTFDGTYFTANGLRLAGTDVTNTIYQATGALGISTGSASGITFYTNLANRYQIDATGVAVWSVGGSESMRLTSTGLGIGTASPVARLEVNQDTNATVSARVANANSGSSAISSLRLDTLGNSWSIISGRSGGYLSFQDAISERMRLDNSGNLGLGVTPSASTIAQFEGGSNLILVGRGNVYASNNATFNSGWKYISTAVAAQYNISGAEHRWFNAASGTAGNAITFTQAMTLDASGNLGIGTTSPGVKLHVAGTTGEAIIQDSDTAKGSNPAALLSLWGSDARAGYVGYPGDSNMYINQINNNAMLFLTNNTERARITAAGNVVAGGSVALATTATDGFLYVPTCAGTPTGTPTAITGMAPIVVNTTNNKLYFYSGGAWRDAGP